MVDITFGNGGKVVTAINDSSTANDITIQPDGKIIIGGSTTVSNKAYFTLVRYNMDGSLDNTFGSNGKVITELGDRSKIFSIALQEDGKIIAGGASTDTSTHHVPFTVVRHNYDGSIDSSFGNNGIVRTEMLEGYGEIKKLLIKSDGKILAAGRVVLMTFDEIPALVQYNTDGSLDSSFGDNGKVERYIENIETITDIALTKDGKIIATGEPTSFGNSDFALLRFFPNGTLDSSFGTNGVIITDFDNSDDVSYSLSVQSDNAIVLAGYSYKRQPASKTKFALAKYGVNGALDSSFGVNGKVITAIDTITALATNITLETDGNLIVSGYTFGANSKDFVAAKYFSNGKLDSTFGNEGFVTTDFTGFQDESYTSAIQLDGKIILAGQAGTNTKYSIALARYTNNILPLKLLDIIAKKDGKTNLLRWTTAEEINLDRFEIQRSQDGRAFSAIGKINPGLTKYNFIDVKPFTGTNYYRLKMIDKDGRFEYSPVRIVINNGTFYISLYPLPAKDRLNIQIQSSKIEKAEISITDISGKTLITKPVSLMTGTNNSVINIQSLRKGVYLLKAVTSETTETRKIIVGQ